MPPISENILQSQRSPTFQLNSSGLAGFFGGDEAISAMNTAQIYKKRRFMGLYNSPGGFRMAKHYGRLAKSRLWRGFYPDVYMQPHEVFSMDGGPGKMLPDFLGAKTGVLLDRTGHLGYLFFKKMRDDTKYKDVDSTRNPTKPVKVTIVNLGRIDLPSEISPVSKVPSIWPSIHSNRVLFFNLIPTLSSIGASVVSALTGDWFAFSLILLGIVAHGAACLVLGSGKMRVDFVTAPKAGPPGDGLMTMEDHRVIVLGREQEVFQVTRASIAVEFPSWVRRGDYWIVGACCLLLMLQLLVQLFLIPQATLFGQVLFLISFGVSWLYNTYLSAIDKEDLQREALGEQVWKVNTSDSVRGYQFQNWTTMAIAMLYTLQPDGGMTEQLLNRLLPNRTEDWEDFKKRVTETYKKDPKGQEHPPLAPDDASVIVQNMYTDWKDAMEFWRSNPRGDGSGAMDTEKKGSESQFSTLTPSKIWRSNPRGDGFGAMDTEKKGPESQFSTLTPSKSMSRKTGLLTYESAV
ncbi:hypothetical protein D9758_007960 [Tetrapyrgos nigripes]|uniref:Uncharacterized protein n=1 Tax=Tetrapyrgos nigripes TaxID=182062 RepID=A0A8H5FY21_9AGAR|nr:hypothetical protein D9758_007960 [Tetrapyrgos nigripes]